MQKVSTKIHFIQTIFWMYCRPFLCIALYTPNKCFHNEIRERIGEISAGEGGRERARERALSTLAGCHFHSKWLHVRIVFSVFWGLTLIFTARIFIDLSAVASAAIFLRWFLDTSASARVRATAHTQFLATTGNIW